MGAALIALVSGVVGAMVGGYCAAWFAKRAARRQVTFQLLERYTSPEFHIARHETWRIRRAWNKGDRSCVHFFTPGKGTDNDPEAEAACGNGLTSYQNLSWLLHFFSSLTLYHEAGLADAVALKQLFEPHYYWYQEFIHEFIEEYRKQMGKTTAPQPVWLWALPKLEGMFRGQRR
jgi:hypothetical protein